MIHASREHDGFSPGNLKELNDRLTWASYKASLPMNLA